MPEIPTIQDFSNTDPGVRPTREELRAFLLSQPLGRIATNGQEGFPHVAVVAFSVHDDFDLVIGTSRASRKARNMIRDPKVAFETTDTEPRQTIQLQGHARLLTDAQFDSNFSEAHYDQLPSSRPFKDQPGQVHILIRPHWLRFSDCKPAEWVLTEFTGEHLRGTE